MQAVKLARQENVDFLLAVGGGSVLDGTKFIAAAIPFSGDPWDILAKKALVSAAVSLGAVLTLPATGSEMNPTAVVTKEETREKLYFSSPLVFPKFSVLDPEATFSLPAIARTRHLFESVGVSTRMSAYDISAKTIPAISDRLKDRGMVALGEKQDITPQVVEAILTLSV